jgi:hypothetical protein
MGKIMNIKEYSNYNLIDFQRKTVDKIESIFEISKINNLKINITTGVGVRGNYEGIENNQFEIFFTYFNYYIECYLSYDQLEYYIFKDGKKLKECNLEDFWEEDIHIEKFINNLKKDLKKLNIPFNDINPRK